MADDIVKWVCRNMAEKIWTQKGQYFIGWDKEVFVDDIVSVLLNDTDLPEMVEFIDQRRTWGPHRNEAKRLLDKAAERQ